MRVQFQAAAAVAAILCLSACATGERISAAGDVHALLLSIRDDDRASFDAHVDRPALEAQMQYLMVQQAGSSRLGSALGLLASGPLSHAAAGLVLRPEVFRAVADYYGYRPDRPIPGTFTLAALLTPIGDGRVCARDHQGGACLMTFADEGGVWKLVDVDMQRVLAGRGRPR
ncbi:MAG TPA: hypothetical protein VG248_16765 [Caulobacteraceae bacterium]|jgi:hypothetical protein|nr:hypothetical protein [Caulobacteraceae bacterium]